MLCRSWKEHPSEESFKTCLRDCAVSLLSVTFFFAPGILFHEMIGVSIIRSDLVELTGELTL